jgi:hypothetical protein
MDINDILNKFPKDTKYCLYVGSFDPFHVGHLEVTTVMSQDCVVVVVPNNPNKSKPMRSELEHRINVIAKSALPERVFVVKDHINDIFMRMKDKYYTCSIMGSDIYANIVKYRKTPHLAVNDWYVVPRYGVAVNDALSGYTILSKGLFRHQGWSSTFIRDCIFDGKMDYLRKLQLLSADALGYMVDMGMYSRKAVVRRRIELLMKCEVCEYIKDTVVCIEGKTICKIFYDKELFKHEVKSYAIMKDLQANGLGIRIPDCSLVYEEDKYCLIFLSYEGASAEQLIGRDNAYDIGMAIGKVLKVLHSFKRTAARGDRLCGNGKFEKVKSKVGSDLIRDYYNNMGSMSYVHGDASLANFVIRDGEAVMIDFNGIDKYKDGGLPAYEYYQFISSIYWKISDKETIDGAVRGFVNGYGETNFTADEDVLFRTYWATPVALGATYKGNDVVCNVFV